MTTLDNPQGAIAPIQWAHYGRSAADLQRQIDWETEGYRVAATAYKRAMQSKEPGELPSAQRLLRDVLPVLIPAVADYQARCRDGLGQAGRAPQGAMHIQLLDAATIATMTLSSALRALSVTVGADRYRVDGGKVTLLAKGLGEALRRQIDYNAYMHSEHDALAAFKRSHPKCGMRIWKRWAARIKLAATEDWPQSVMVAMGTDLLALLRDVAPDKFSIDLRRTGRHTHYALMMSEDVRDMLNDVEQRAMVARPLLLPMRIPPNPWRSE